jgi:hypothetical protein
VDPDGRAPARGFEAVTSLFDKVFPILSLLVPAPLAGVVPSSPLVEWFVAVERASFCLSETLARHTDIVLDRSGDGNRDRLHRALPRAVERIMGAGWTATPTGMPREHRIAIGGSAADHGRLRAAEAWQRVHDLRATGYFERVEPVFPGDGWLLQADPGECAPIWPGAWNPTPDPEAMADSQWSLSGDRGANVVGAWATVVNGDGQVTVLAPRARWPTPPEWFTRE